ncbi:unnamed protein product [Rhizoctonia solani]|uniref:BTB domain-containing protein n=1 Tax=Rhizoctonia solani TaxID=456999 RepID=A0A8H2XX44_9AGAM|nr:unnamed protein product [Rhizoctonia solani]CAE6522316.1 unnamed protein product [Rhizoctonia solani]
MIKRGDQQAKISGYILTTLIGFILTAWAPEILPSSQNCYARSGLEAQALAIEDSVKLTNAGIHRHPEFYFDGTLVFIQIQGTLFNVHKGHLLKSAAFSNWFELQGDSRPEERSEGLSPDSPIFMQNIEMSDFEALLKALYTPQFSDSRPSLDASFITSAFRMADLWQFTELRAFLLDLADQLLGDVDKIAFAKEFGLKAWLLNPHVNLCQRDQQLNLVEAKKIGIDNLLIINNLREEFPPQKLASNRALASCCNGVISYKSRRHCSSCLTEHPVPTTDEVKSTIETRIKDWIGRNA